MRAVEAMAEQLLTDAEMREAINDPNSQYYFDALDMRQILNRLTYGVPLHQAVAMQHRVLHRCRDDLGRHDFPRRIAASVDPAAVAAARERRATS